MSKVNICRVNKSDNIFHNIIVSYNNAYSEEASEVINKLEEYVNSRRLGACVYMCSGSLGSHYTLTRMKTIPILGMYFNTDPDKANFFKEKVNKIIYRIGDTNIIWDYANRIKEDWGVTLYKPDKLDFDNFRLSGEDFIFMNDDAYNFFFRGEYKQEQNILFTTNENPPINETIIDFGKTERGDHLRVAEWCLNSPLILQELGGKSLPSFVKIPNPLYESSIPVTWNQLLSNPIVGPVAPQEVFLRNEDLKTTVKYTIELKNKEVIQGSIDMHFDCIFLPVFTEDGDEMPVFKWGFLRAKTNTDRPYIPTN